MKLSSYTARQSEAPRENIFEPNSYRTQANS